MSQTGETKRICRGCQGNFLSSVDSAELVGGRVARLDCGVDKQDDEMEVPCYQLDLDCGT